MQIQHDRALDIATGNSRKTKTWKNKTIQWSALLQRLSQTTRTGETMAEYRAMGRNKQSETKDVGGFVGGYCSNGRRSEVAHRSVLCLDADFADADLWSDWEELFGYAAAVYSTHKHTTEKPRLRMVIPLSRSVSPDEYQAVGRKIAQGLGIDKFDDTTYDAGRLMYWPSTSQDGAFVFKYTDAPFLDPDLILSTYHDWRDITSWPTSSRAAEVVKRSAAKQQDPLEKPGLVGAFCRAYTLPEAIEAYVPSYQPCDEPNRYTYTEGSTAAGVVVYDDKWSYSHHASDPASSQLVNAWDLVRLHRFSALDEDVDPDTPASKRPSYKAMVELAGKDKRVTAQIVKDRKAQVDDFDDLGEDTGWESKLKTTEKGTIAQTIENAVIILQNDPRLAGRIAYNALSYNIVAVKSLPWRQIKQEDQWSDADDAALRLYLERAYGISSKDKIYDAVNITAQHNSFHPVRDYLADCRWDGVPRVDTLLIDYLGAEDTPYTRAVTRKTLVAAVARVYKPGCKFDYMLTIQGEQGIGKSALAAKLGGKWFSDSFMTVQGKDAYEQIQGVWIMEVGELAGMRKAEAEAVKHFVSKQADRFRPAYGRRIQEFPRQCVFIGTTNESQFLRDSTGNRRFWVVDTPNQPTKDMWDDLTPETIKLIWGEAVELFKKGEKLRLPAELEAEARRMQDLYEEENPRAGIISAYLDRLLPENWDELDLYERRMWLDSDAVGTVQRETVCVVEIWAEALGGAPDKIDRLAVKDIRDCMAGMPRWHRPKDDRFYFRIYGRQRYYRRAADERA